MTAPRGTCLLIACACAALLSFSSVRGDEAPAIVEIRTPLPNGTKWMRMLERAGRKIEAETDDRIELRFALGTPIEDCPDAVVYTLPLLFADSNDVARIRERLDPLVIQKLAEQGLVTIGMEQLSWSYVMSQRPIRTAEDLLASRAWIPPGEQTKALFESFGLTGGVPLLLADVRSALEEQTVDTVVTPPAVAVLKRWHRNVTYVTDLPLAYVYVPLAVQAEALSGVSEEDRSVLVELLGEVLREIGEDTRRKNEQAMRLIRRRSSIEFVQPNDQELASWRAWAVRVRKQVIEQGLLSADLVKALDDLLAEPPPADAMPQSSK
ncbi:MAG: TRAP transporter substrate-binding protein DctP [Lentisphaerae bacterium]|nr:TRAP transporter substrate-binding protein DctP [Lentisphaerota bacterium]